jgi:hypothetical protein
MIDAIRPFRRLPSTAALLSAACLAFGWLPAGGDVATSGVALTFRSYPGLDHDPTMDKSTPDQLAWIRERFAGKPVSSNCGDLPP